MKQRRKERTVLRRREDDPNNETMTKAAAKEIGAAEISAVTPMEGVIVSGC